MDKQLGSDPLFLGLTRPAIVAGVPQGVVVVNMTISMMAFLMFDSFLPLLLGAPLIHGLAYWASLRDIRIFDICLTRARFVRCLNRRYWGANSYDPFR